jgi:hypothetical protein
MANGVRCRCGTQGDDSTRKVNAQEVAPRKYTSRGEEHLMDADDIIERMRQVYAVKYDSELALALGLTNWRQRNSAPADVCVDIARKKGISLDWLIFGVGDMRLGAREGVSADTGREDTPRGSSPEAERLSRFVYWWHVNRTDAEMTWLEQQFKRAVPEYGEWLEAPMV